MDKQHLETMKKQWYNTDAIAFEMIKCMKHRESVFIATNRRMTHRMLKINAVRYLYKNFEKYEMYSSDNEYNIYNSVAHFPELPMASWKWSEKQEQMAKFNANFLDYMTGYDFFLDLDNPDIKKVHEATTEVKTFFDFFEVPYYLIFSGKKGFHICVDFEDFPSKLKQMNYNRLARLFKIFAYELKLIYNIDEIDTSIFDLRRIKKVPYSVVYPDYNIALPLSDEEFDNFKIEDVSIKNLLPKAQSFKKRGLLKRKGNPKNLLKLIEFISRERSKIQSLYGVMKLNKQTLYDMLQEVGSDKK